MPKMQKLLYECPSKGAWLKLYPECQTKKKLVFWKVEGREVYPNLGIF